MAKPIGTLGTVDSLTVAGRVFSDMANLISLYTYTESNTKGTFRKSNGSAGYPVTTAKTLTLGAMRVIINAASSAVYPIQLAQSDNDLGLDSSSSLTNPLYYAGASTAGIILMGNPGILVSGPGYFESGGFAFQVAATKYASIVAASSHMHIQTWGYEA